MLLAADQDGRLALMFRCDSWMTHMPPWCWRTVEHGGWLFRNSDFWNSQA